ncbi:hypothetical protein [Ralstonia sp. UBA689]|uniref:hypothetical protein n=1 Tax=Ralstonia sp. UBA689 TaxID=1947373 RepID=UPI0025F62780|nr:hypothetical protein [Ralstonia sp. UBA689]
MLRSFAVACVVPLVAACATSSVSPREAATVPQDRLFAYQASSEQPGGRVTVTRDDGFAGRGCLLGFYVDGKLAGSFEAGETARFFLPPGEYVLGAGFPKGRGFCAMHGGELRELSAEFAVGQERYYRMVNRPGDGVALEATTQR